MTGLIMVPVVSVVVLVYLAARPVSRKGKAPKQVKEFRCLAYKKSHSHKKISRGDRPRISRERWSNDGALGQIFSDEMTRFRHDQIGLESLST
jgi:hypothetical protein